MKRVLWIFVSLVLQGARAETCDSAKEMSVEVSKAIEFLRSIEGYYEGDSCNLSIHMCSGGQVGEVLLVDKNTDREAYLPIHFQPRGTERTRFDIQNGRRMFHYEFTDLNPDPAQAGILVYLFEAVKTMDQSRLEYVEFGLRGPKNSRIQWAVCHFK